MISRSVRYFAIFVAIILAACTGQPAPATLPASAGTAAAQVTTTTATGVLTATAPVAATRVPSATGITTPERTPTRPPANTPTATGSPTPTAGSLTLVAVQLSLLHEWRSPPIAHLAWSPDGASLAVASTDGVTLYDAATLHQQRFLDTQAAVLRVAYSADGRLLAAATQETLQIWEVASGQQRTTFSAGQAAALAFSPDSRLLAVGAFNGQIQVYEVNTGRVLWDAQQETYLGAENMQAAACRYLLGRQGLGHGRRWAGCTAHSAVGINDLKAGQCCLVTRRSGPFAEDDAGNLWITAQGKIRKYHVQL